MVGRPGYTATIAMYIELDGLLETLETWNQVAASRLAEEEVPSSSEEAG
jgi:hypothetical protein